MTTSPTTHRFRRGARVRFVSVQEQQGEVAPPDRLTAAFVGTIIGVTGTLDHLHYLVEFDAPPVRGIRSRRATYPAESLVPWPPEAAM